MDETANQETEVSTREGDTPEGGEAQGAAPPKQLPGWWPIAAILLLCFLVYSPALQNGFTMDDRFVALGQDGKTVHPLVQELHAPPAYFARHYWADHQEYSSLYRPITVLSFALRHALFGDSALAAHLINILLHQIAVWLSYLLVRGLGAPPKAAAIGAAVFAMHALRSEVVASVVGRSELLGFVFGAGALLLLLRSRPWEPWSRISAQAGSALLLFLALCSKESAVAWVPFIVMYDLLQRRILQPGSSIVPPLLQPKRLGDAAIVLTPLVCYLVLRYAALGPAPEFDPTVNVLVNPIHDLRFDLRALNALMVWGYGLVLSILPFQLSADYGASVFPIALTWSDASVVLALLSLGALGALLFFGLRWFREHPLLAVGPLLFLGFSFLTSNVVVPIGTIFGDRLYYTPALALSFFAAWVARGVLRHSPEWLERAKPALLVTLGAWFGINLLQIAHRIPVWRDNAELFAHESQANPSSARMLFCIANVHMAEERLESAAQSTQRALEICPQYVMGWNTLGRIRYEQGRYKEAVAALEEGYARLDRRSEAFAGRLFGNLALAHAAWDERPDHLETAQRYLNKCMKEHQIYWCQQTELIELKTTLNRRLGASHRRVPAAPRRR